MNKITYNPFCELKKEELDNTYGGKIVLEWYTDENGVIKARILITK